MPHTSGSEFVKKSRERELAKNADIFVAEKISPSQKFYQQQTSSTHDHPSEHHVSHQPHISLTAKKSQVRHQMTARDTATFLLMRTFGNFLLLFSLYGVIATFGPTIMYEVQFKVAQARGITYTVAEVPPQGFPDYNGNTSVGAGPGFGEILAGATDQVLIPPDPRFSIVIPKIGATAKVHPNVDPLNEKDFLPLLQTGVAHARGTVFPGMQGNVYLFAHSTDNFWNVGRYNAVFYLVKELKPGDDIYVYFEDRRYNYKVQQSVVKDPSDVDLLVKSQELGKKQLILQTCWPPGTTWKRLFVIATPQEQ